LSQRKDALPEVSLVMAMQGVVLVMACPAGKIAGRLAARIPGFRLRLYPGHLGITLPRPS